jgi:hypothetical protein
MQITMVTWSKLRTILYHWKIGFKSRSGYGYTSALLYVVLPFVGGGSVIEFQGILTNV